MGLPASFHDHARRGDAPYRGNDRTTAPSPLRQRTRCGRSWIVASLIVFCLGFAARAETFRIATWNVELWRDGPGLLLRDILRGEDAQILAIAQVIRETRPDVLLLQGVDYDLELKALRALADLVDYPHIFALRPNAGRQTGLDLNGNGRAGDPEDAQSYGVFSGQGGMAILSRFAFGDARDFTSMPWQNLPDHIMPEGEVYEALPLSSMGHWVVKVKLPSGDLTLMTFHASTPVFDGPEDRNGRRNHDEIRFWIQLLDGTFGPAPKPPFVIAGQTNQDRNKGEGRKAAIRSFLSDPRLQDPLPNDPPSVEWPKVEPPRMRVSYVLPDAQMTVIGAGTYWPEPTPDHVQTASRHRLVWTDITLPLLTE